MTKTIPPGIAMPDEGQTRLGPLTFFDGFPDAQAAARICDSQTRSMLQKDQDCPQTGSLDKGWDMPFRLDARSIPGSTRPGSSARSSASTDARPASAEAGRPSASRARQPRGEARQVGVVRTQA